MKEGNALSRTAFLVLLAAIVSSFVLVRECVTQQSTSSRPYIGRRRDFCHLR